MSTASAVTIACRAKINLCLQVTGRRDDGFHELISLAVPVAWEDRLTVTPGAAADRLDCTDASLPCGAENLVLKAAAAFRQETGYDVPCSFALEKRIPAGAGYGGGSADAAGALLALNKLAGNPLNAAALQTLAAKLGSDVPLFLMPGAALMRGRGEVLEPFDLPESNAPLLLFKPSFPIATQWAYAELARRGAYSTPTQAEATLASFSSGLEAGVLQNDFQPLVFDKYLVLPLLFERLQTEAGGRGLMSGSGSGCFWIGGDETIARNLLREHLGGDAFCEKVALTNRFLEILPA